MYCGNCGTKNDDSDAYCKACGAPLTQATSPGDGLEKAVALQNRSAGKKKVIIVMAAIVVILLVAWFAFGGRGYKDTVEDFFEAGLDGDVQGVLELLPEDLIKNAMASEGYDMGDMEEFISQAEDELQGMLALGGTLVGDLDFDIDITGDTDIKGADLQAIQEDYQTYNVDVSKAKYVHVTLSLDTGALSGSEDIEVPVIKVGRSWYLDVSSL